MGGRLADLEERRNRPVVFRYPTGRIETYALRDEASTDVVRESGAEYKYMIQLLEDEGKDRLIRMTYYRRPLRGDDRSWVFAGQTSITTGLGTWAKLFALAMETDWFRALVEDARAQSSRSTET